MSTVDVNKTENLISHLDLRNLAWCVRKLTKLETNRITQHIWKLLILKYFAIYEQKYPKTVNVAKRSRTVR